jgi:hypothetical protein
MNERFKELAKQAGMVMYPTGIDIKENTLWGDRNISKFAELIVEKFDDILVLEQLDCVGNKDKQAEERIERLREKVKTYFGVEQ